jgi:Pyruvate/2-oxoacid:ferredoxin oxidoreductase gamma subunit
MAALGALARLGRLCRTDSMQEAIRRNVPARYVELGLRAAAAGEALAIAAEVPTRPATAMRGANADR